MNRLESVIYRLVRTNPRLKKKIVGSYQRLLSIIPVKAYSSRYEVVVRKKYFFGFHDKTPWSADNGKLLAHQFDVPYRATLPEDTVKVGYFSGRDFQDFTPLAETRAWSWQQGSMLQWLGNTSDIIFNDFDGEKHISRVVNNTGGVRRTLPKPVAAVNPAGSLAVGFDFCRFESGLPGYGYVNGSDPDEGISIPSRLESGLYSIEIETGVIKQFFSVADITALEPHPTMEDSLNFFSHCLFSPSGKRLVFFHRWLQRGNRLWTRMISCDPWGGDIFIFPTSGMVSHIAWQDDEHILAYARTEKFDDRYYLFRDRTGDYSIIGEDSFDSDGHPQFSPDGRFILTDTYPDRRRIQRLIVYDTHEQKRHEIARFHLPLKFNGVWKVDLHPRWNRDGSMICVDSGRTGERSLCTIKINLSELM